MRGKQWARQPGFRVGCLCESHTNPLLDLRSLDSLDSRLMGFGVCNSRAARAARDSTASGAGGLRVA